MDQRRKNPDMQPIDDDYGGLTQNELAIGLRD